jgi:hypothetical protein
METKTFIQEITYPTQVEKTYLIPVLEGYDFTQVQDEHPNTPCYYKFVEQEGNNFTLMFILNTCNGWDYVENTEQQTWVLYLLKEHLNPTEKFSVLEPNFLYLGGGYEQGSYSWKELETTNFMEVLEGVRTKLNQRELSLV